MCSCLFLLSIFSGVLVFSFSLYVYWNSKTIEKMIHTFTHDQRQRRTKMQRRINAQKYKKLKWNKQYAASAQHWFLFSSIRPTVRVCFFLIHSPFIFSKVRYFSIQIFSPATSKSPLCINYALIFSFISIQFFSQKQKHFSQPDTSSPFLLLFSFPLSNNIDSNIYNLKSRTYKRLLFVCPFSLIRPYLLLLALFLYVFFSSFFLILFFSHFCFI